MMLQKMDTLGQDRVVYEYRGAVQFLGTKGPSVDARDSFQCSPPGPTCRSTYLWRVYYEEFLSSIQR